MDKIPFEIMKDINNQIDDVFSNIVNSVETKQKISETFEVLGGLFSRQVVLSKKIVVGPNLWDYHIGPIILRVMIDNFIQFKWIIGDADTNCKKFIEYGLGQQKLILEKYEKRLIDEGVSPSSDEGYQLAKDNLDSERYTDLINVNVGQWNGKTTRTMANETKLEYLYDDSYHAFSSAIHNNWFHISNFNLKKCENPLHGNHKFPVLYKLPSDFYFVEKALTYLDIFIEEFVSFYNIDYDRPNFYTVLEEELTKLKR